MATPGWLKLTSSARLVRVLAREPGVRDRRRAELDGLVLGRIEVGDGRRGGLDEQDLAVLADGVCRLDVEGDLERPARVLDRGQRAAALIHLLETAVRRGARQAGRSRSCSSRDPTRCWDRRTRRRSRSSVRSAPSSAGCRPSGTEQGRTRPPGAFRSQAVSRRLRRPPGPRSSPPRAGAHRRRARTNGRGRGRASPRASRIRRERRCRRRSRCPRRRRERAQLPGQAR